MIIKTKELNVQAVLEQKYFITEQNLASRYSFLNNKQGEEKQNIQKAFEQETNAENIQIYENILSELRNNEENITPSNSEIVFCRNDGDSDKYNLIQSTQDSYDNINNEVLDVDFDADLVAEELSNGLISGSSSEINSELGKQLFSFFEAEIEGEMEGGTNNDKSFINPYDDDRVMPFTTVVNIPACKGLRRDYLTAMRKSRKEYYDEYAEKYARAITNVTIDYFANGITSITKHVGGSVIAAVGTSTMMNCSLGFANCYNTLVSFYRKRYSSSLTIEKEAKTITDAFSAMYDIGILTEKIVGTYVPHESVCPFVAVNSFYKIDSSLGKQSLYISLLSVYKTLEKVVWSSDKLKRYKTMGLGTKFEDTDDLIAMAMASGLKAMISLTKVTTNAPPPYGSTGTALLIPSGA